MDLPDPEHLHTTEQAARALDVPPALIRKWAHREQIKPAGHLPAAAPGGKLPLYHLSELEDLVERYHSRRRPTLVDGVLTARCACGNRRSVPIDGDTSESPCPTCHASMGDGLIGGPDRVAVIELMGYGHPDHSRNVIYFARVGNLVKIGTTSRLWQRMAQLGYPDLLGVMPGAYKTERQHHRRFDTEHVTGEIFIVSDRLLAYIEEHCTRPMPPDKPDPLVTTHIPRWTRDL